MKRLILAAIILFPAMMLVGWFYWGSAQNRVISNLPQATNAVTNAPAPAKP